MERNGNLIDVAPSSTESVLAVIFVCIQNYSMKIGYQEFFFSTKDKGDKKLFLIRKQIGVNIVIQKTWKGFTSYQLCDARGDLTHTNKLRDFESKK